MTWNPSVEIAFAALVVTLVGLMIGMGFRMGRLVSVLENLGEDVKQLTSVVKETGLSQETRIRSLEMWRELQIARDAAHGTS